MNRRIGRSWFMLAPLASMLASALAGCASSAAPATPAIPATSATSAASASSATTVDAVPATAASPASTPAGFRLGAKPWDRGELAKRCMRFDGYPLELALDEHIYFSKEASSGGSGFAGGGCGCN